MPSVPAVLDGMIRKFERRAPLSDGDRDALRGLPFRAIRAEPGRYLVREGSTSDQSVLILSGLAYRHKISADGSRQIVSIHIPGDFVDLDGALEPAFIDVNVTGTLNLLEAAAAAGNDRFVFTSTTSLMGRGYGARSGEAAPERHRLPGAGAGSPLRPHRQG